MNREKMQAMIRSYLDTQDDPGELAGFLEEMIDKAEKRGHIEGYKRGAYQGEWARDHVKEAVHNGADGQQVLHYIAERDFDKWQIEQKSGKS